jgi:hypothetical protein
MSVRFIAGALSLGLAALVACGSDSQQARDTGTGGAEDETGGVAGESSGGAPNQGGDDARAGGAGGDDTRAGTAGAAGADSAAGAGSGEGGSAGGCSDETCLCTTGERGCACDESSECADGLTCHPELGCAKLCEAASDDGFVIDDAAALEELVERACDALQGSLWLVAPDLEDIAGLESLKAVSGDLLVSGTERLVSLQGLSGLAEIGGSLVVQGNAALGDLSGLEALRSIGRDSEAGALVVSENPVLTGIAALASADISGLYVTVSNNPTLTRLAGLGAAVSLSHVVIVQNERLESLNGLAGVTDLESLTLADNGALPDVNLPALESAGALTLTGNTRMALLRMPALSGLDMTLTVATNPALESIEMDALESVLGSVTISNNATLARFELAALDNVGALTVTGNARLPQCAVDALNAKLEGPCAGGCSGNDANGVCQ